MILSDDGLTLFRVVQAGLALVARAKARVPASVKFYSDYVKMLDEEKPDAVIVTTENDKHLAILRDKGILSARKDANRVYYRVEDARTLALIRMMRDVFCTMG